MSKTYLADLGWCMARLEVHEKRDLRYANPSAPELTICCPADTMDESYAPPSSVRIYGEKGLRALRDLLNEHLDEEGSDAP